MFSSADFLLRGHFIHMCMQSSFICTLAESKRDPPPALAAFFVNVFHSLFLFFSSLARVCDNPHSVLHHHLPSLGHRRHSPAQVLQQEGKGKGKVQVRK
jgi:hypothetical protein